MFEDQKSPRVFAVPIGTDFSASFHAGLIKLFEPLNPLDVAKVRIFVNTRRMQRRLRSLFQTGPTTLLPRISLITDIGEMAGIDDIPPAQSPLRRKLEIAQLVKAFLKADPTLGDEGSAFELSDALVALMSEMQGEGVPPETIASLDVEDQSGHWQRSLQFLTLVQRYFDDDEALDAEGRQRRVVEELVAGWQKSPPKDPILIAGSTGSRGTTSLLMEAVAQLPQGAVILPGFDTELPSDIWNGLQPESSEDHPQYRFKAYCDRLSIDPLDIPLWHGSASERPERNKLISLSLRPAPVTDQWITEGAQLNDLPRATQDIALIEAPTPRAEADAIAVRLRQAVEDGQTAALITPDRVLTRQVTAALDRWRITPDDSAGRPLHLTAPGRFLRHVADLFTGPLTAELLLVLLRHPLTNTGDSDRNTHILNTNALELELRRNGPPFPSHDSLHLWAEKSADKHPSRRDWVDWLSNSLFGFEAGDLSLTDHVERHLNVANALSDGLGAENEGELWKKDAGREAFRIMSELERHADAGGTMNAHDYRRLVQRVLAGGEVRNPDIGHPKVLIWGTLEARVQSTDLVILGGMNDGTWPEAAAPDPWLNRSMRQQAGLLLPERRIGLSAHDYQQAVCAKKVVISRAIRSDEAETVPSRWINRLTNLLGGLKDQGGPDCLESMRMRGQVWLETAKALSEPTTSADPAPRPSPAPPSDVRPKSLSVTQIKTLIRDPYAIYARHVLKLSKLDPLTQIADAPLRGTIIHEILERFIKEQVDPASPKAANRLIKIADDVLDADCPWPAMRSLWRAKIQGFTGHFLSEEIERQANSANIDTEIRGELPFPDLDFVLTGYADRIDLTENGEALIYDYKTGTAPTSNQQIHFDKQLLLEAGMVQQGAFKPVGRRPTAEAMFIGLGSDLKNQRAPLDKSPPDETLRRFAGLIKKWRNPAKGYTSRSANERLTHEGPYDHLARYGEWDETHLPDPEDLT
ncbi:MAG: double-strand break repair protein AddB [Pseudomonadota bacterium]